MIILVSVESDGNGIYKGLVLNSQFKKIKKKKCFFIWEASIEGGLKTDGLVNFQKINETTRS